MFFVHRVILGPSAGKAQNCGFSSDFVIVPLCGPGCISILPFVCFDFLLFKLSIVWSDSYTVFMSHPAQQGPDLIGNLMWHQYHYITHQFSLLFYC